MILTLGLLLAATAVPDAEIKAATEAVTPEVIAVRRDLHAHPELSNRLSLPHYSRTIPIIVSGVA